ncbi:mechanosensitive ion channel [Litoribacter alkaliphilus]|uniref:Mechanosensitive ion channel n=1 Tax=Litoribacter ruber TaxID=702568 RepID=A0AAP2CJ52_9BACT|nr:mechanosensitive ion channel domain-containing protein [Litoribacter alkaliphilus]MBS9524845.1 mechanosensitive ion channel [Litoribacter alkaliphilus]
MNELWNYIDEFVPYDVRLKVLQTIIIILILWLIKKGATRLVSQNVSGELKRQYHWQKTIQYVVVLIGLLLVGSIWITNFQFVTTYLGLLSAGIAIALKDIFVNIAGWFFIYWRRPFDVGDRIQIGEHKGDVVDLRMFQFSILEVGSWVDAEQSTGRIIHIPNGKVFSDAQANYSQGFDYIWNEQHVYISLDSDHKKAQQILLDIMNEELKDEFKKIEKAFKRAEKKHLISFIFYTPTVYINLNERGIQLSMRYLCPPRKRRVLQHAMIEAVLEKFRDEEDIRIVYPITSVHLENRGGEK